MPTRLVIGNRSTQHNSQTQLEYHQWDTIMITCSSSQSRLGCMWTRTRCTCISGTSCLANVNCTSFDEPKIAHVYRDFCIPFVSFLGLLLFILFIYLCAVCDAMRVEVLYHFICLSISIHFGSVVVTVPSQVFFLSSQGRFVIYGRGHWRKMGGGSCYNILC